MRPTWSISTDPTPWPWGSKISRVIQGALVKRFRVPVDQNVYSQRSSICRLDIGRVGYEAPPTALSLPFVEWDHIDWEILCTGHPGAHDYVRWNRRCRTLTLRTLFPRCESWHHDGTRKRYRVSDHRLSTLPSGEAPGVAYAAARNGRNRVKLRCSPCPYPWCARLLRPRVA